MNSSRGRSGKLVSIICPIYNERDNLTKLYGNIKENVPSIYNWELILVDDGSTDGSLEVIRDLCRKDGKVKAIFLSRNFGHQYALSAGYDHAKGDAVITMDADLQHPPEIIPKMLNLWEQENDIVFAIRDNGLHLNWFKRISSHFFYKLLNKISGLDMIQGAADFRLLDKKVCGYLKQCRETDRFIRGIISEMGFKRAVVQYQENAREYGESKYNFRRMMNLAWTGVFSFSVLPLRISIYFGILLASFSFIYSFFIIYDKLVNGAPSGIPSIIVGVFFIGGVQLISIGILGEYLIRVFREVKDRPLYFITESINVD